MLELFHMATYLPLSETQASLAAGVGAVVILAIVLGICHSRLSDHDGWRSSHEMQQTRALHEFPLYSVHPAATRHLPNTCAAHRGDFVGRTYPSSRTHTQKSQSPTDQPGFRRDFAGAKFHLRGPGFCILLACDTEHGRKAAAICRYCTPRPRLEMSAFCNGNRRPNLRGISGFLEGHWTVGPGTFT